MVFLNLLLLIMVIISKIRIYMNYTRNSISTTISLLHITPRVMVKLRHLTKPSLKSQTSLSMMLVTTVTFKLILHYGLIEPASVLPLEPLHIPYSLVLKSFFPSRLNYHPWEYPCSNLLMMKIIEYPDCLS